MSIWAMVVAAGSGSRFGGLKQYERLGGRRVLDWAVQAARTAADGVVLVVPPGREADAEPDVDAVVAGAATRSGSVRAGLTRIPAEAGVIVVHDAVRPFASPALFQAVVAAVLDGVAAAVPGLPVLDTVKRVSDGAVLGTVNRAELVTVQTPQAFLAPALRWAHRTGAEATDDAALLEAEGRRVVVVPGELANIKITGPDDWADALQRVER